MKYFLIAGEASGDLHASALIEALKKQDPQAQFEFLGGDLMAHAAGKEPVIHYSRMAYMGFAEVLRHAKEILGNFKHARQAIASFQPDALVLIDYPSFNLKMAKHARKLGIPVYYYISPKVWAWKEWRVKTIKKVVDKMLAIFPFEVDFYAKHGMQVEYVGNPSVEEIERLKPTLSAREDFLKRNKLPDKKLVALLPGSRMAELRSNLPIMEQAMKQFPQYWGIVAAAPGIDPEVYKQLTSLPIVYDQTYDLLANAHAAVVTSGTATLETALMGVPQVAMFRHNGSKLFRKLKDKVLSVKYVTLPNLICDREIIPELLLDLCTPDAVADRLCELLPNSPARKQQLADYATMRERLGPSSAPEHAASIICHTL